MDGNGVGVSAGQGVSLRTVILLALAMFFAADPAFAYIDPNAGGLLYQVLAPVLIAAAAVYGFLKKRISILFGRLRIWVLGK